MIRDAFEELREAAGARGPSTYMYRGPMGRGRMFVTQTDMDFGNDWLPLVEAALRRV